MPNATKRKIKWVPKKPCLTNVYSINKKPKTCKNKIKIKACALKNKRTSVLCARAQAEQKSKMARVRRRPLPRDRRNPTPHAQPAALNRFEGLPWRYNLFKQLISYTSNFTKVPWNEVLIFVLEISFIEGYFLIQESNLIHKGDIYRLK